MGDDGMGIGGDDGMGGLGGMGGFGGMEGLSGSIGDMGGMEGFGSPDNTGFNGMDFSLNTDMGQLGVQGFDGGFSNFGDMGIGTGEGLGGFGFSESASSDNSLFSKLMQGILGFGKNAAINSIAGKMGIPGIAMSMGKGALGAMNAPNQNAANQSMAHGFQNGMMGMLGLPGLAAQGVMGLASAMGAPNNGMSGASSTTGGNSGGNMGGGGLGQAMGGLASLYGYNQANKSMNQQANSLGGMYGQDSPFAQGLRQQLDRRDAAGGRRSQYGPREVELQAKLAQLQAGNAGQIGQIRGQQNQMRAQGLAQLIAMMNKSGATGAIGNGLQGLFNSGMTSGVSSGMLPSDTSGMPDMSENPFAGLGEF